MKPVLMTSFGWPDGNCFAACVASIFEVALDELPSCPTPRPGDSEGAWLVPFQGWFAERGLILLASSCWRADENGGEQMWMQPGYAIVSCAVLGAPPCDDGTELRHAVVARDGHLIHNPQPGFENDMSRLWPREYQYFVALDPSRMEVR